MDDDRIASELQRRASGASLRPDWAQRDLLPAVLREIDARPAPVLASRWSPLASVATLVVALLVLVVAVPRLGPQPPSATATPSNPLVLSTADFAAQLAEGDLLGRTVLVQGSIRTPAGPAAMGTPCAPPPSACYMGELANTEPAINIAAPLTPTTDLVRAYVVVADGWRFWHSARPPIEGTLLLAVSADGAVQFLGVARAGQAGLIWSVTDAAALDINSLGPDEVVLVDGWLDGQGGSPPCPMPSESVAGLPALDCAHPTWLLGDQYALPDSGLRLQTDGYFQFARDPSPADSLEVEARLGTYALARRLVGWGCPSGDPPCWLWYVLARLDPTAGPSPIQTPSAQPTGSAVLSTADFAAKRAAGELDGKTVLVNGRIDPDSRRGPACLPIDWPCFMGVLAGADPPVDISWRWVASTGAQANRTYDYQRTGWQSWYQASTPVEGTLILAVGDSREVQFLGVAQDGQGGYEWSVADAETLDPTTLRPDEAVVVRAWLVDIEPPGTEIIIDCVSREWPDVEGLPSRYCAKTDHLSSQLPVDRGGPMEADRLPVQAGAAQRFGGNHPDESALYAIAPRLYGGGCAGEPPCWLWDVVARVNANPEAAPTPTSAPTNEASRQIPCGLSIPVVLDGTGLVQGCIATQTGPASGSALTIANVDGDESRLVISWAEACSGKDELVLRRGDTGLELVVSWLESGMVCDGLVVETRVELQLSVPIPAEVVTIRYQAHPPEPTPTPSPWPITPAPAELRVLSTDEFEAALDAGTLRGQTVLVNGSVPETGNGTGCLPPPPDFRCVLGALAGTDSRVHVWYERWPEKKNDGAHFEGGDIIWPWWGGPDWPVEGTLLLRVTDEGAVQFIGRVHREGPEPVLSMTDVAALDVESIGQEEAVLVDGWLNGIDSSPFCSPVFSRVEGLPSHDWCNRGAWLMAEQTPLNPSHFSIPPGSIPLQSRAFDEFAPQPGLRDGRTVVPQRAIYAITRRLFGDGRGYPEPPNWGWAVVGRVD